MTIWQRLGLPGLYDVHTHFLPPQMAVKVRAQFDRAGPLLGRPWPIRYRGPDDDLATSLVAFGVRRFTALTYAHRPGMAEWLNDWTAAFAERVPGALRCATVHPEADAAAYTARRLAEGAQ